MVGRKPVGGPTTNNRAEKSHLPFRRQECARLRFRRRRTSTFESDDAKIGSESLAIHGRGG